MKTIVNLQWIFSMKKLWYTLTSCHTLTLVTITAVHLHTAIYFTAIFTSLLRKKAAAGRHSHSMCTFIFIEYNFFINGCYYYYTRLTSSFPGQPG